ncbi:alpha-tocopherol transfer protein-like [Diorhabda sublineata]|uniref:alpha-tocopherol transfer protein-like n=1 Tax=Diorhabda sublineata TaxID=1163346 RepID=UPI0024E0E2EF|nr:alpha-tocopherol transfer protein-like [Diorhabda sublineata]
MQNIEKSIEILKEWIMKQPHLTCNISDLLLRKFLIASNYSIEVAKELIDIFYTLRLRTPELFANRNFYDAEIQDSIEIVDILKLPKLLGTSQILVARLNSTDIDKYHFQAALRMFTIFDDVQLTTDETFNDHDIVLIDLCGFTMKHLSKLSLTLTKKVLDYIQEARPANLKAVHFINVPNFMDKIFGMVKPFVRNNVMNMIHFHLPNSTALYDHIPKELLPEEYGGTCGTIAEYKQEWLQIVTENQSMVTAESYWKIDESKRINKSNYEEKFSTPGSFKKLDID